MEDGSLADEADFILFCYGFVFSFLIFGIIQAQVVRCSYRAGTGNNRDNSSCAICGGPRLARYLETIRVEARNERKFFVE